MLEKALTGNRTYWSWIFLLLAIIGVGIFFTPSRIAQVVDSPWLVMAAMRGHVRPWLTMS